MITKPEMEWWDCPACFGAGVTIQHGPAVLKTGIRFKRTIQLPTPAPEEKE